MKKIIINAVLITLSLSITSLSISATHPSQNTIFQVATIGSLAQGVYDGDFTYGKLQKKGNFGLGTFLDLNGEMVAVDGHYYQIEANGKLRPVTTKQIAPFAEVTFFNPTIHKTIENAANYQQLGHQLSKFFLNKNIPYAIRIDGTFKTLRLRSLRKQQKPYPTLVQASEKQAIFNLNNVKGTVVGFWFPSYWGGIAVAGFHLHFVTADRTTGGHVLEIALNQGKVSLAPVHQLDIYLPETKSFAHANLSSEELHSAIKKAEGGSE
ncbi:alpha-acetolactate decarboxylase [Coxiella burnetii]|uniref:acetolactate decarboxylase n=1 Tax=Coxiella burnetii TaxID=777 RepID=UPI0000DAEC01|nr:acetolactate decarboxylase [Coxiella burnetii]ACJ18281.1 alpha-acetolactate decarboxylase [Coxiella burnetii CbuG_Q212]AML49378.1 alpha-acetolactate decarboxylase [Coxiella burnetii]AML55304.1 alpha-acetolactate decarboxylase [Coxiella burnetii]ATN66666.1 alpha-acetolactate decarboxylase [Coxiella burnetii]ATN69282.1 alpha-acetolactate decarboxylase [Coxiella burnetii]